MPFTDPSRMGDVFLAFLGILFEGAPYILLGTLISGFIDAYLPANLVDRLLPRNRPLAILASGLLGAIFPVCECAIVPVIRRLVQKGLPISCAITYMLSAPIVNPVVAISTWAAFSEMSGYSGAPFMTVSRLAMAYIITVTVGMLVHRFQARDILRPVIWNRIEKSASAPAASAPRPEQGERLVLAMRTAMRDFLDTGMYFTIGVLITAILSTQIDQGYLAAVAQNDAIAVPALMGLAFILSLCSTSDAFIIAQLTVFSPVAKLGFLVFGPMMDVKLVFMYSSVFRKRFVLGLLIGLAALVALLCLFWSEVVIGNG